MKAKERIRSRNLSDTDLLTVVEILDGWTGKLTWEALIEASAKRLKSRYTRQTLYQHERIRLAFGVAKLRLREATDDLDLASMSRIELEAFSARYSKLVNERDRLQKENESFLEQFVVWAYNAHTRGLDEAFLNRPLPGVDRGRTKSKK